MNDLATSLHSVAVVGAGTMGRGIAQAAALAGYPVTLYDVAAPTTPEEMTVPSEQVEGAVAPCW